MATILIVDDEPIVRQLFQKVMEHEGHIIHTAANGREALEVMRTCVPDLIMLDLQMPAMDGYTFLRLIRRHLDWAHIPVVIVSALASECDARSVGELGVRDYMVKAGFSLPVLRKRLAKYLNPPTAPDAELESAEFPGTAAAL